jgi:hypothetical protein
MIVKILLTGCLSCCFALLAFTQIPAVGNWREHLPYHQAIGVAGAGEKIWCATPYSLFLLDISDNSMTRLSKITGLHATGISAIQYDSANDKLIVAYTNSNIDILSGGQVFNIPDILQSPVTGNKTVYQILAYNDLVYLSTGLGVVVLDEDKYEVKDTWVIGGGGDTVMVSALAADGSYFYAATPGGVLQAPAGSPGLSDFHTWSLLSGAAGLSAGPCQEVAAFRGNIIALRSDSLFLFTRDAGNTGSGSWNFFYADAWQINGISVSGGQLMINEQQAGSGRVLVLGASGAIGKTLQQGGILASPRQSLAVGDQYFVADSLDGLSGWSTAGPERYIPNSPQSIALGDMSIGPEKAGNSGVLQGGVLWAASGGADSGWNPLNDRGSGVYRLKDGSWTNYNGTGYAALDSIYDFVTVASDPLNPGGVWAGSFGEGLLQIKGDSAFTVYAANSPLGPVQGQPSVYRVSGLAFDAGGNLWIANYGAVNDLVLRKADGSWMTINIPFAHTGHAVSQILTDDNKQVWIVSPLGNGLFCYNHGASLDNTSDDQWKFFQAGQGNGNLPDNNVYCIARDKSGFIWVGTANGIGLIQCTQNIFSAGGCEAVLPVVQFDNFAGYLFSGEQVQAIAVDGADRKWVGTRNGVWLISPDAQQIVYHFTADNSPLLNNDTRRIAVDPQTGEVFFETAGGTCSFRGTATEGAQHNSGVLVFPNPVPPGYTGTIAVRGLVDGAIVKITEMDGRLVYQTRALGGQAVWDGRDYTGHRASTGVYLVLVSDDSRQEKAAAKIVFIGK